MRSVRLVVVVGLACLPACGRSQVFGAGGSVATATTSSTGTSGSGTSGSSTGGTTTGSSTTGTTGLADAGLPACPSGLLAYYTCNGDLDDASGNGNDATPTGVSFAPGMRDLACDVATPSGSISLAHATGELSGARTFCAWVNPEPTSGFGQPVFEGGAPYTGDMLSLEATGPTLGTCATAASTPFVDHWSTPCNQPLPLTAPPGVWSFVCWAYDGKDTLVTYVDAKGVSKSYPLYDYALATLFVGSNAIGGTTSASTFEGLIEGIGVWGRQLASGEVGGIFSAGGCQP